VGTVPVLFRAQELVKINLHKAGSAASDLSDILCPYRFFVMNAVWISDKSLGLVKDAECFALREAGLLENLIDVL